ncbi:MAG: BatD family protein [Myxococcota bacterium]|nr:BatD family protein [Myxococcota bacterium]
MSTRRARPLSQPCSMGFALPVGRRSCPVPLLFLLLLASIAAGGAVWAGSAPQIQVQADRDVVAVGEVVHVQMNATSSESMPSAPQLASTPGFVLRGQNASPSQTLININGQRMDRYGLSVDWLLQAQRVGAFSVGPVSVVVGGARYASPPIALKVVPAGQAPARRPRAQGQPAFPQNPLGGFSPLDPWRGLLGLDPSQEQPPSVPQPSVVIDPALGLDSPRGAFYFLRSTVDKRTAVVGEPLVFSVYEYVDLSANVALDGDDAHDASVADFVKRPLVREDQEAPHVGYAMVGGHPWEVKLLRRWALFPVRSGELTIGPMSLTLRQPRSASGSRRASEEWRVQVTEPPAAGRPQGYALGDVGRFSLTAQVSPRQVDRGGAVSVHVEISGSGNVPSSIATPAQQGVEWLTPEVHEQLGPIGQESFGGKRLFDFVVRVSRAGDVDLGDLTLPFWNPEQKRYEVARAALGLVHVSPSVTGVTTAAEPLPEILPGLPAPREALEGMPRPRAHLDDSRLFWLAGIGAGPMFFGLAVAGRSVGRLLADASRKRRVSPATELRARIALAREACERADTRMADAATARALQAATQAYAGVSVLGAVGDEVVARLETVGVGRDVAAGVAAVLRDCEAARFSPDPPEAGAARERWLRAQRAIQSLQASA